MASAKITLIGFEKYLQQNDDSLFSGWTLPDGIDSDDLQNNILLEAGDFEVLYSDPEFLQEAITLWAAKWYRTFEKWVAALAIDYEPLENYDRQEDWTDTGEGTNSGTNTGSSTASGSTSDQTDYSVTAYEDDTLHQKDQTVSAGSSTDETSSTVNASGEYANENVHTGRVHGNIGVTTSQQMLLSELDVAQWNLLQHITDIFIKEFCLLIYE